MALSFRRGPLFADPFAVDQREVATRLHLEFQTDPKNLETLQLCSNALSVLEKLHSHEFNLAVVSNRSKNHGDLIAHCGLRDYVRYVVGHEHVSKGKPDPEGIHLALAHFNVVPSQAVIVGDTVADVIAGKNASIHTVAVE